jgi:hypothetical protein
MFRYLRVARLATHRVVPVSLHAASRSLARMVVVVSVSIVTNSISTIIWSLIGLEPLRFAGAFVAWRKSVYVSLGRLEKKPRRSQVIVLQTTKSFR